MASLADRIRVTRHTDTRSGEDDMGGRGVEFQVDGRTFAYYFFDGHYRLRERTGAHRNNPLWIPLAGEDFEVGQPFEVAPLGGRRVPADSLQRELAENEPLLCSFLRPERLRFADRTGYHKSDTSF
jgi:hypothetical protein